MSRHAVRVTVAVAALSLAVLGSPVQAQDTPSAAQEVADLRNRAEAGDADAQTTLGWRHINGEGVQQDDAEAIAVGPLLHLGRSGINRLPATRCA